MIYCDNIIFSLQKAGGISVVWQNLLSEMQKKGIDFFVLEYGRAINNIFRQQLKLPAEKIVQRNFTLSKNIEQLLNVQIEKTKVPFIFHSSYYRLCSNSKSINVTTVHDFIYEKGVIKLGLPERIRVWQNHRAIYGSEKIVCISENTRKDLLTYLPNIDENKVIVIYNGVSEDYRMVSQKQSKYQDYILFVGGREGYKNFDFVVKSLAKSKYNLLICGNELLTREKTLLDECLGLRRYHFILRPSNKELNLIYNSVYCLIYPSSYEGFGIPILEAQRAGCPVIALNSSSIPEVVGDGGLLLQKLDSKELLSTIADINSGRNRVLLIEKGLKNSLRFSWEKMASEYISLYKSLLR